METLEENIWFQYPPIVLPSPILALATDQHGVWAGGAGGVAWYPIHSAWEPRISGLHLSTVAALAYTQNMLFAGGNGGVAYSYDRGLNWQAAEMPDGTPAVTALLPSPQYAQDKTVLAATLDSGIMRSDDGGKIWRSATFGLQNFDITSLLWASGETVLAGTIDGIYRSTNAGRAWKLAKGSDGLPVAALAYLADGTLLAALESGGLLSSQDNGLRWHEYGNLSPDVQGTALLVTENGTLLLGTTEQGILRSTDSGNTWNSVHDETIFSFTRDGETLYGGTVNEVSVSVNDGETWIALPHPPIHDLRSIINVTDHPLLAGTYSGLLSYNADKQAWVPLNNTPRPLSTAVPAPDGALLVSSEEGLARSADGGTTWELVMPGIEGQLARITFRTDGSGWAGSSDGSRLYTTHDNGIHWEAVEAPFGVLPLTALQVAGEQVVASTYDPRQYRAQFWRTLDEGKSWQRGMEVEINWPIVATWHDPALITLGALLILHKEGDTWQQTTIGNGQEPARRVVGDREVLVALTTQSLFYSQDNGVTWNNYENAPVGKTILDIALHEKTLYILLVGGQIWSRPV